MHFGNCQFVRLQLYYNLLKAVHFLKKRCNNTVSSGVKRNFRNIYHVERQGFSLTIIVSTSLQFIY